MIYKPNKMDKNSILLFDLEKTVGRKYLITDSWKKQKYSKGWRYGSGNAFAVVQPATLIEIWRILKICVKADTIVIMQAANTGLTGGSTPYDNDYDRPIVIVNTMRINGIHIINGGKQILGLAGSTLYDLEKKLKKYVKKIE